MNNVTISEKTSSACAVVCVPEFLGIFEHLNQLAKTVSSNDINIDFSLLYDTDLFNFDENSTALKLWKFAANLYLAQVANKDFKEIAKDYLRKNLKLSITPTPNKSITFNASDLEETTSTDVFPWDNKSIANEIFRSNILDIVKQWETFIEKTEIKEDYCSLLMNELYWEAFSRFVNNNWEEIFTLTEELVDDKYTYHQPVSAFQYKKAQINEARALITSLYREANLLH